MSETTSRFEKARAFLLIFLGSVFVQCFFWAMYSYLELSTECCVLSALISALCYHFLQIEKEPILSRVKVFLASILIPFLLAGGLTTLLIGMYPNLRLLNAQLDGVSPAIELLALYSARLLINGVVLMLFAGADAFYLRLHPAKEKS